MLNAKYKLTFFLFRESWRQVNVFNCLDIFFKLTKTTLISIFVKIHKESQIQLHKVGINLIKILMIFQYFFNP